MQRLPLFALAALTSASVVAQLPVTPTARAESVLHTDSLLFPLLSQQNEIPAGTSLTAGINLDSTPDPTNFPNEYARTTVTVVPAPVGSDTIVYTVRERGSSTAGIFGWARCGVSGSQSRQDTRLTLTATQRVAAFLTMRWTSTVAGSGQVVTTVDLGNDGSVEFTPTSGVSSVLTWPILWGPGAFDIRTSSMGTCTAPVTSTFDGQMELSIRVETNLSASWTPVGVGCAGSVAAPVMTIQPGHAPFLGLSMRVNVSPLPVGQPVIGLLGFRNDFWGSTPLPLVLDPIGMFGCRLYNDLARPSTLTNNNGTASWTLNFPLDPGVVAVRFHQQIMALDPAGNPFGAILSNSSSGRIGVQ